MPSLARRMSRRSFLAPQAASGGVSAAVYADWVERYRSGRFVETARRVRGFSASDLRKAQVGFVKSLPPSDEAAGLRGRLAAALVHAEAEGHFGWGRNSHHRLIRDPLRSLPRRWPAGVSAVHREAARAAWGDEGASDFKMLIRREVILTASRLRLARMDLASATRILEQAEPRGDAALLWQLAVVKAVRARYVREDDLWPEVRDALRDAASRQLVSPSVGRVSSRVVARCLSDPDDRNLRLALAALGMGRKRRAADRLSEVSEQPATLLRVPRLLIEAEALLAEGHLPHAIAGLREAVVLAPASQAAVAALVAALEAHGQWDEAAALASEQLRLPETSRPWTDFLITWAEPQEPALDWLHDLLRA